MKALRVCGSAVSSVVLAVWMTGCVCSSNRREAIPTITCQPVDMNGPAGGNVEFKVTVSEKPLRYEWGRLKLVNQRLVEESLKDKPGGRTDRLSLSGLTYADETYYFCTIVHESPDNGDVHSRTRNAYLEVTKPIPQQLRPLSYTPSPYTTNSTGNPYQVGTKMLATATGGGTQLCDPADYTTSIPFTMDIDGKAFLAPVGYVSCELMVDRVNADGSYTEIDNTKFGARWSTPSNYSGCANDEIGGLIRAFNITSPIAKHFFTIYFVESQTAGTIYRLTVTWKK